MIQRIISEFLTNGDYGFSPGTSRVLLWSRPGREATLVALLYSFFVYKKKKTKGIFIFFIFTNSLT